FISSPRCYALVSSTDLWCDKTAIFRTYVRIITPLAIAVKEHPICKRFWRENGCLGDQERTEFIMSSTTLDRYPALFRIIQEALANVARHSGARAARVALYYEEAQTRLTISDQGRGFDPAVPRNPR